MVRAILSGGAAARSWRGRLRTSGRTEINAALGWWDFEEIVLEMGLAGKGGGGVRQRICGGL